MLFLVTGLLPLLAWMHLLPSTGSAGAERSVFTLLAGLPFAAVGMYFMGNALTLLLQGQRLSDRLLFHLGIFSLSIPFHYWLFFGKPDQGAVSALSLPGGLTIFSFDTSHLSFLVAKVALGFLLAGIDLYLLRVFFRLGRSLRNISGAADDSNDLPAG